MLKTLPHLLSAPAPPLDSYFFLQEQEKFDEIPFLLQGSQEQEEKKQHDRHSQVVHNIVLHGFTNLVQSFLDKHNILFYAVVDTPGPLITWTIHIISHKLLI